MAQYRWRGMGPDVLGTENSAVDEIFDGHYQDWQLGVQYSTPIGNRPGHAAVRNAELMLSRERARLREMELEILDDASRAFGEVDRAYAVTRSTCNRIQAAHRQLEEVRKKYDAGTVPVDFLLDAQQRVADADSLYHRSLVDYTLSLAKVNRARGTLLDYYDVALTEGPWCDEAYASAAKQARRFLPKVLDYTLMLPPPVSRGPCAQQVAGRSERPNDNNSAHPTAGPAGQPAWHPSRSPRHRRWRRKDKPPPLPPGAAQCRRRTPCAVAYLPLSPSPLLLFSPSPLLPLPASRQPGALPREMRQTNAHRIGPKSLFSPAVPLSGCPREFAPAPGPRRNFLAANA